MNRVLFGLALAAAFPGTAYAAEKSDAADDGDDITLLDVYSVTADRVEEFGFRTGGMVQIPGPSFPLVIAVVPNTAAAKAGLRPGDRILKEDGKSAAVSIFSMSKWRTLQSRKAAEAASGKKRVTWVLEVQSPGETTTRTVSLIIPTPAPHWGAAIWQPPEGRGPSSVGEAGPVAQRSREVFDHGVWMLAWGERRAFLQGPAKATARGPLLGYEWSIREAGEFRTEHRIFVTQQRGRTEIVLDVRPNRLGSRYYLTSPSGALEKAWTWSPKRMELPLDEARTGFEAELDFWVKQVDRGSGRWPFELKPGFTSGIQPPAASRKAGPPEQTRSASFLARPPATDAQRAIFAAAFGKIGADEDCWSYTETARGLDDKRETVVRVDPSSPEGERCVLLKVDGKPPTATVVQKWRDEGRDVPSALGELPPLASIVDLDDVRVASEEIAAIVFELPLRIGNPNFPADKFQALFRVNKATLGFEDIIIRLRESFRFGVVAKVTDAGLEIRFQSMDPVLAPQPVSLKAGGSVRLLLVKFGRSFEATRTDFRRVEPARAE